MREIRTLRAMWRGLETQFTVRIVRHSQRKRGAMDRPDLRSHGASPRPYRARTGKKSASAPVRSTGVVSAACQKGGLGNCGISGCGEGRTFNIIYRVMADPEVG